MLSLITSASIGTLSKTLLCARHCRTYFSPCVYSGVKGQLITCRPQAPFLPLLTSASQNSSQPTLKKLAESQRSDGKHAISIKGNADFDPADHFSLKSVRKLPGIYATLSKSYLTLFVVMTMDAGYCLAMVPFDQLTFYIATIGTLLCACSANTLNQIAEVEYDALMERTQSRPLVRKLISPSHAFGFAAVCGLSGTLLLYAGTNLITSLLGLSTILLYATVYTPLKRIHWCNTWVGAIVGAIPPVMGWTAATGQLNAGAFIFSGILYAWQFPHFYALAWRRRSDYARGSYHMLPLSNPQATKYVVVTHALSLWALCFAAPHTAVASWAFVLLSTPLNVWLTSASSSFFRHGNSKSAKKLYKCSLYYIVLLSFALVLDRKLLNKLNLNERKEKFFEILSKTVPKETLF